MGQTGSGLIITLNSQSVDMTVLFNNSNVSPGYDLSLTGLTPYSFIRINSRDPEGHYADQVVRGTDKHAVSGDTLIVSDYEFQQFRSVDYILDLMDSGGTVVDTITVSTSGEPEAYYTSSGDFPAINTWIKSPSQPELNLPCYISTFPSFKRTGRVLSNQTVLGRTNPIVFTDVISSREGSFVFLAGDYGPYHVLPVQVEQLFAAGDVIMLHCFDDDTLFQRQMYFRVLDYTMSRYSGGHRSINPATGLLEDRYPAVFSFEVNFIEVDRPATTDDLVSVSSWQDVKDVNLTWQDVKDNYTDWLDVLANPRREP